MYITEKIDTENEYGTTDIIKLKKIYGVAKFPAIDADDDVWLDEYNLMYKIDADDEAKYAVNSLPAVLNPKNDNIRLSTSEEIKIFKKLKLAKKIKTHC